jgi:hypothetical protein
LKNAPIKMKPADFAIDILIFQVNVNYWFVFHGAPSPLLISFYKIKPRFYETAATLHCCET